MRGPEELVDKASFKGQPIISPSRSRVNLHSLQDLGPNPVLCEERMQRGRRWMTPIAEKAMNRPTLVYFRITLSSVLGRNEEAWASTYRQKTSNIIASARDAAKMPNTKSFGSDANLLPSGGRTMKLATTLCHSTGKTVNYAIGTLRKSY